jgi:hypothetical protein
MQAAPTKSRKKVTYFLALNKKRLAPNIKLTQF